MKTIRRIAQTFSRLYPSINSLLSIKGQNGVALMMVLWVMTILTAIVFSFSYSSRIESYSSLSFKEGVIKKLIAEAGIERGIAEIFYRRQFVNMEGSGVWRDNGAYYADEFGDGVYSIRIINESGKIDINMAPPEVLKGILVNSGVDDKGADIIVDSIFDWKDADDLHRLHGAENEYYRSLPTPYNAKNAPFETVEELLLVKGMSSDILYGAGDKKGIIDSLTVNSKMNVINVNSAPAEVLMAVPGLTAEIVSRIIEYREIKEIRSMSEITGILGESYAQTSKYINVYEGMAYFIESIGYLKDNKAGYRIAATVVFEGINKHRYLYYKSPATSKG
ncbi:MAG: type II secretion system protein GspK [Nitrospirae bacterium]|nr:type II secretion system protein GspK [Nitrospirota bacterium]